MATDKTPEERIATANVKAANQRIADDLAVITEKTPEELRVNEKAHLQARASYLSRDDRKKFRDVLREDLPKVEKQLPPNPQAPEHIVTVEQAEAVLAKARKDEAKAAKEAKNK